MQLFLIVSTDANGDTMDHFVNAATPERAVELWRSYYDDWSVDEENIRVFSVPAPALIEGPCEWGEALVDTRI